MKRSHSRFRAYVLRSLEMCVVRQLNSPFYELRFSRSVSFLTMLITSTLLVPGDVYIFSLFKMSYCVVYALVSFVYVSGDG